MSPLATGVRLSTPRASAMPQLGTGVQLKGWDKVNRLVAGLEHSGVNTTQLFRVIGHRLRAMQVRHFQEEKDSVGQPWPHLSPTTIERRAKGRAGATSIGVGILKDTGRLRASLSMSTGQGFAVVGTNVIYAATHQFGDEKRKIPKREFVYINSGERDELTRMLTNDLIVEPLRAAKR